MKGRVTIAAILVSLGACEMDDQPRYNPFEARRDDSTISSSLVPPDGSLPFRSFETSAIPNARDQLAPLMRDERAQARRDYLDYCSPCHGATGAGDGEIIQRGFPPSAPMARLIENKSALDISSVIYQGRPPSPSFRGSLTRGEALRLASFLRETGGEHFGETR
jgi:hypothetical protein